MYVELFIDSQDTPLKGDTQYKSADLTPTTGMLLFIHPVFTCASVSSRSAVLDDGVPDSSEGEEDFGLLQEKWVY